MAACDEAVDHVSATGHGVAIGGKRGRQDRVDLVARAENEPGTRAGFDEKLQRPHDLSEVFRSKGLSR